MKSFLCILCVLLMNLPLGLLAQVPEAYVPETDPLVLKKLEQWQDLKFGLMLTWGPYSQWGVVESWSLCGEDEPWCQRKEGSGYAQYKKEYEDLSKTFNPAKFDPQKWAKAAKDAGIRYVLGMAKHHDGFCMFDTRTTDYRITHPSTPFSSQTGANVLKEILDAFRNEGIWPGIYFSKPDWHTEYYWWSYFPTPDRNVNYDIKKYPDRWRKFVGFTHTQIEELMTGYGPVDILWLDGGQVQPLTRDEILKYITAPNYKFMHVQSQDINMAELARMARTHQPGLIVVDRAVPGKFQNYMTPENVVPDKMLPYPWESCITATNSWSFTFNDKYKSSRELIHMLVDIVSKGGNLLLNIGPGPDGTWQAEAYDRLREIGGWMKVNGEAIYGTRAVSPFKEGKVCLTGKKDGTVYAIYLSDADETAPPSKIWLNTVRPAPGASLTMLGVKGSLKWEQVGNGVVVDIPTHVREQAPGKYAWTIKMTKIAK
jgi:alpha-L-fucosidase